MTMRTKTVAYPFDTLTTGLAATTRHEFAAITITLPETVRRTFKSVAVEITARDDSATAVSMTAWLIGIKLGAAAFTDVSVTSTMLHTSEHQSWLRQSGNLAAYFNTNFGSGATQTCQVAVSFTAMPSINVTAKLIVTYEYDDDAQATLVKTVPIVIDSPTAVLTAVAALVGGAGAIPRLTGGATPFLPEASVTILDVWLEVEGNEAAAANTAWQLGVTIDAAAEVLDGSHRQDLISSIRYKYIHRLTGLDPTAAHDLKLRGTTASRMNWASCVVWVTYTYDVATTTRVNNVLALPFQVGSPLPVLAFGVTYWTHRFQVREPGTITLKQSGVVLNSEPRNASTNASQVLAAGSQAIRTYTFTAQTAPAGGVTLSHRIDAGAQAGAGGLTLAAGSNTLDLKLYSSTAGEHHAVNGMCYLVYESDVASEGEGAHAHSTYWGIRGTAAAGLNETLAAMDVTPNLPEAWYCLDHVAHVLHHAPPGEYGFTLTFQSVAPDERLASVRALWAGKHPSGSQTIGHFTAAGEITDRFKRFESDARHPDLMDINLARAMACLTNARNAAHRSHSMWITYSALERYVADVVGGYDPSGDGSGITVEVFDPDDQKVYTDVTTIGGDYSAIVADSRSGYYAVARQGATRVGRSDDVTPSATVAPNKDGPLGVQRPLTDAQWLACGVPVPRYWYTMQDFAGNPRERRGDTLALTFAGLGWLYRQSVTGWKAPHLHNVGAANARLEHIVNTGIDIATQSFAMLVYASSAGPGTPGAGATSLMQIQTTLNTQIHLNRTALGGPSFVGKLSLENQGTPGTFDLTPGTFTGYCDGLERPFLLVYNRTAGTIKVFTNEEVVVGVYPAAATSFGYKRLGGGGSGAIDHKTSLVAMWGGSDAESLDEDTLIGLGWGPLPY
jgi:hypothetical protein